MPSARLALMGLLSLAGCDRLLAFGSRSDTVDGRAADLNRHAERGGDAARPDAPWRDSPLPETGCRGCLVGGRCWKLDELDPTDADRCRICDPDFNPIGWAPAPGCVITLAGDGSKGHNDGPGAMASFLGPRDLAVGADGTVYVADTNNHAIRTIIKGLVRTLAGDPTTAISTCPVTSNVEVPACFADGPLNIARFNQPRSVGLDESGALIVADTVNDRIRKISGGRVDTLFAVSWPLGVTWHANRIYVSSDNRVSARDEKGAPFWTAGTGASCLPDDAVSCFLDGPLGVAKFNVPRLLAVSDSEVFVADEYNNRVRRITAAQVGTLAGSGSIGSTDAADPLAASVYHPTDVAVRGGLAYIADEGNCAVRRVPVGGGAVTTLIGGCGSVVDGPLVKVRFASLRALDFDAAGRLHIVDENGRRIRVLRLP